MDKQEFQEFIKKIKLPDTVNSDFIFDTFTLAIEGSKEIKDEFSVISGFSINEPRLILYIVNEHIFYMLAHQDKTQEEFIKDEDYQAQLASISLDKYYTNEHLAFQMGSLTSKFNPSISTLDLYLNFVLGMLSRTRKGEPSTTLIIDVLDKGFQMAKCVSDLLSNGFETEAFSTWRTLHENECILEVLVKNGKPAMDEYVKHIRYGIAFRGGIPSKEETDKVFENIKEEMKELGLKSKDMKRFIEYGWLKSVKGLLENPDFKFNFRDGVERAAGLTSYSKVYEMSSEIAHSSPLLIYSRKNYFYSTCILNLYESFFRIEKIFSAIYTSSISELEKANYLRMRNVYFGELQACYAFEKARFANLTNTKN